MVEQILYVASVNKAPVVIELHEATEGESSHTLIVRKLGDSIIPELIQKSFVAKDYLEKLKDLLSFLKTSPLLKLESYTANSATVTFSRTKVREISDAWLQLVSP